MQINPIYIQDLEKNIWNTIVYGYDNISEYETFVNFKD